MNRLARKSLLVAGSIGVAAALAACSSSGSGSSEGGSGDDVTLTMWLWPGMGFADKAKQYEEENPGIKINIQEAEYADAHQNLITALAAGSGAPDISGVDEGYLERIKESSEMFYDLADYGAADLEEEYLDWKWAQASSDDGSVIGIPTDIGPMAMAYRVDLFEEAGLPTDPDEVAQVMSTWDDYIKAGQQLMDETGTYMFSDVADLYSAIREQGQKQYFETDGTLIIEDSPQILKAWDKSIEAMDIQANIERQTPEWGAALANGDFATVFLPPWMLQNIKNDAPDTSGLWDIALMPEGSGNWGGSFLTVPAQSDHPEEAYEFITWLMSPENQLDIFEENGNFPSTPGIYDEPAINELDDEFFIRNDIGAIYAEAATLVEDVYRAPMTSPINTIMQDALGTVADGAAEPEAAWDQAMLEVDRQISR
ncbi:extracellular solute-binding protein [Alkalicoccobacillus murimartini]|uniref:Cellobiose transport system substrate-binding protein n=1 Tax=Alkalicoccobacillus murimartini TaxID=171685 RepID=A0ABT9YGF1_9BACI|nr:extracellular solute-binding protein [Alkalicoccobacillus murimartini]MDQ0206683.1 cellobiose transport system substrate-binding protein [Alkalicoccobacillus murimartini]